MTNLNLIRKNGAANEVTEALDAIWNANKAGSINLETALHLNRTVSKYSDAIFADIIAYDNGMFEFMGDGC